MRRILFTVTLACGLLAAGTDGAAWDPDECCDEPWSPEPPSYDPPAYAERAYGPPMSEPVWEPPSPEAPERAAPERSPLVPEVERSETVERTSPDVRELAAERGLHEVTEVRDVDRVITDGDRTTYVTETRHEDPGTFAVKVAAVETGERSAYDAVSANRRLTMSDGRPVGGDYYETYVYDPVAGTFAKVSTDFFADDSELRKRAAAASPAAVTPLMEGPLTSAPHAPDAGAADRPEIPTLPVTGAYAIRERETEPLSGGMTPASLATSPSSPGSSTPRPHDVRAGVALAPQADALARIEVLRGRRVDLWMRATVDGALGRVIAWRLASGEVTALGPVSGIGDAPFVAQWLALASAGTTYLLRFDVTVAVVGEAPRVVPAAIEVAVRSPAIVE